MGFLSVPVAIAVLVAMSATGRQHQALALFELVAGAAFLGSVLGGLLLGHWYLTDRGLTDPIERAMRHHVPGGYSRHRAIRGPGGGVLDAFNLAPHRARRPGIALDGWWYHWPIAAW